MDVEEDIEKLCQQIHSKLAITTTDGDYEGVLKFISLPRKRATFEHVFELPSRDYFGTMHILLSNVLSWTLLECVEENFEISNFDSSDKILNDEFSKSQRIDISEVVKIPSDKHFFEYLPMHLRNNCPSDVCIVDSVDTVFYRALKHLSESAIIGVSFHGPKISRSGILTWLCLSTSTRIFLFDIEYLGKSAFEEGLKQILENKKIEKVLHDCREFADCVLHLYNTELNCIFDTQVADYLINMQMCTGKKIFKYVNSLDSVLFKYLKVPQQFLYNRNKCASYEDEVSFFQQRPINKDFINVLMKSVMYLLILKEKQEKLLMFPYKQVVELYLDSVRSASDSEVHIMLTENAYVAPNCLLESIKPIRFCDLPQATNNSMEKLKEILCENSVMSLEEKRKYFYKLLQNNCS